MVHLYDTGVYLVNGTDLVTDPAEVARKDRPRRLRKRQPSRAPWPMAF